MKDDIQKNGGKLWLPVIIIVDVVLILRPQWTVEEKVQYTIWGILMLSLFAGLIYGVPKIIQTIKHRHT